MEFKRYYWLFCIVAIVLPTYASASSIETLMMPGKVIKGHAKYEEDCDKCHQTFSKSMQSTLCMDCHKKIGKDVEDKKGFHGILKNAAITECKQCHTEHKGRNMDVVRLDKETFNHKQTDFPLKGAHTIVQCKSCHKKDKKYREAKATCFACHKEDDPHKERLGKKCSKCHNENSWTRVKFDHDKTDYPLKGKHKKAACNGCHPNERYKDISTVCYDCHRLNDIHATRYGKKCKDCHTPEKWTEVKFNHDKDTEYKLIGRHKKVLCDSCHKKGNIYDEDLGTKCIDCHKNDDEHKGRYGKKCKTCHTPRGWGKKIKFDHDKDTDFKLRGKHKKADCETCHKGDIYEEELETSCFTCHRKDDVHKGEEGKVCERCHNENNWGEKIVFDHDVTYFPLIGLHATTPCEECHLTGTFKAAAIQCVACHHNDDEHKKRLGPDCELCHNPNDWTLWEFDHDKQTDYELDGAHKGLDCHACHKRPVKDKIELSTTCGNCHKNDDIHDGGFGKQCERCHITESFDELKLDRQWNNRSISGP
ncbi:MAG: cytochrome c3 family protein [Gammaproteobacteria bacterium]